MNVLARAHDREVVRIHVHQRHAVVPVARSRHADRHRPLFKVQPGLRIQGVVVGRRDELALRGDQRALMLESIDLDAFRAAGRALLRHLDEGKTPNPRAARGDPQITRGRRRRRTLSTRFRLYADQCHRRGGKKLPSIHLSLPAYFRIWIIPVRNRYVRAARLCPKPAVAFASKTVAALFVAARLQRAVGVTQSLPHRGFETGSR